MKKHIRILTALLCLLMLIALAGCHDEPTPSEPSTTAGSESISTTSPTSTSTPTTAPNEPEPQLDAAQLYLDALAEHDKLQDLRYNIDRTDIMTAGRETFTTTTTQQIEYLHRGTDDFASKLTETMTIGDYTVGIQEVFIQDFLFQRVGQIGFATEFSAQECMTRYLGAGMIDPALYATSDAEIVDGKTILRFRDASALENWLATDADKLISAEAEITLDRDGALQKIIYHADFNRANVRMTTQIELYCRQSVIDRIDIPPTTEEYIALDYIDAPRQIQKAYCLMLSSQSLTFQQTGSLYVTAAGYYGRQSYSIDTWGSGSERMALLDLSSTIVDQSTGDTYAQDFEERFENGKYSYSIDGSPSYSNPDITIDDVDNYIAQYIGESLLDLQFISDIQCTDLGSILFFEISGNEELGLHHKEEICSSILADPNILDDLATDYRTEAAQYYFAIDVFTGLPTAMGIYYEGIHTIDGYEYWLVKQIDNTVYCASMESYEAITEKSAPDDVIEDLATPLFYHVTGDNGQEMWLLGTIHVGDNRTGYLPDEIYDAFIGSDALAVECNTRTFEEQLAADEALQQAAALAYYYSDGSVTSDHISDDELYQLALKYLKATGNYFDNVQYMKVSSWASTIENYYLRQAYNLSSDKGMDNRLLIMAEECDKPILEVESCLFQIQMLNGWSEPLQQVLLEDSLSIDALEYMQGLEEMYELWCSGDEAALTEYLNADAPVMTDEEQKLYEEYNKAMSTDRNAGMVQTAIDYLESGETVFYAVGLAHVLAENGLVNALRDAGYTVEIVTYK